jgi:hypothetical protein
MKNYTIILTVLIAIAIETNAQIPNNGFESLSGWFTGNATLSTDHYPSSIGNYSIKLENQLPIANNLSYGYAVSGNVNNGCIPSFPISGHPNQLRGYYKCFPLNNDTIQIGLLLFNNGVWVAGAELTTTNTVSSWTSFTIPISAYTVADSATITLAAFYNDTTCGMPYGPFGNSTLYVDNISFDNLITSVPDAGRSAINIVLYPNPASENVTFTNNNLNNEDITIYIYNIMGALVKAEKLINNQQQINVNDLDNGIYFVSSKSKDQTSNQKLIIQR